MGVLLETLTTTIISSTTATVTTAANSTTSTTVSMSMSNSTLTAGNSTTTLSLPAALSGGKTGCQNGSSVVCDCASQSGASNSTRGMLSDEGSLDALLYIVVVLLFYAFSIVVLMVKYIRRENKEAYLRQYFDDFVAREQFQSPQARNQYCLKTIMDKHDVTYISKPAAAMIEAGSSGSRGGGSQVPGGGAGQERHVYLEGSSLSLSSSSAAAAAAARVLPDPQLSIPETICEMVEGGEEEEEEGEGFEDEMREEFGIDVDAKELLQGFEERDETETTVENDEQVAASEELLPRRETPV